ncbi:MAG: hypothetical protein AAFX85_14730, partial [Pseudomonadota bacterium]
MRTAAVTRVVEALHATGPVEEPTALLIALLEKARCLARQARVATRGCSSAIEAPSARLGPLG